MVKRDDWGKIILDREGLQLLGSALYWRWEREVQFMAKWLENEQGMKSSFFSDSINEIISDHNIRNQRERELRRDIIGIQIRWFFGEVHSEGGLRNLFVKDFRFKWHHLWKHRIILPLLKGNRSAYAWGDEEQEPLVERLSDRITLSLEDIFLSEAIRLDLHGEEEVYAEDEDQRLFAIAVSDICEPEPPRGRGRPKGSVEDIGDLDVVEEAVALIQRYGITVAEGVRRALANVEIVRNRDQVKFGSVYGPNNENAEKRIRKKVDERLKIERAAASR